MTFVLGRSAGPDAGPTGDLGACRALDGSDGAGLAVDLDGPHAALVVGKRGSGKSYTLGVLAEALARTDGLAPVVVDPMGAFATLADGLREGAPDGAAPVPVGVVGEPAVAPGSIAPRSWCALLGLSPESGAGSLLWRAAAAESTVAAMCDSVRDADAPGADRRSALNHLRLAESWEVFDPGGLSAVDVGGPEATVLDVSGLDPAPRNAVVRGVASALYRARVADRIDRLPWLLVDEAHAFFDGVAGPALETVLTRGRAPGVSLVLATQRPGAVPAVARSQSDIVVAHRLTARSDRDALDALTVAAEEGTRPPTRPGEATVVDDATGTVHAARIRRRHTPHGGANPSVSRNEGT